MPFHREQTQTTEGKTDLGRKTNHVAWFRTAQYTQNGLHLLMCQCWAGQVTANNKRQEKKTHTNKQNKKTPKKTILFFLESRDIFAENLKDIELLVLHIFKQSAFRNRPEWCWQEKPCQSNPCQNSPFWTPAHGGQSTDRGVAWANGKTLEAAILTVCGENVVFRFSTFYFSQSLSFL